jgi:hypothetical protein
MKTVALITNLKSRGLLKDTYVLTGALAQHGCSAFCRQFDQDPDKGDQFDLAIHLEVFAPAYFPLASRHWYLCNPEFLEHRDLRLIERNFEFILAKTQYGYEVCSKTFGDRAFFLGFTSEDRLLAEDLQALHQVLHDAGASQVKGTKAVIDAWKWEYNGKRLEIPLIVVCSKLWWDPGGVPSVTLLSDVGDLQLQTLQNESLFHLQPSETEGFGHVMYEALSCGRYLITTDAPPMNEIDSAYKITPYRMRRRGSACLFETEATEIYKTVEEVQRKSLKQFYRDARVEYARGQHYFYTQMGRLMEKLNTAPVKTPIKSPQRRESMRIAFLGNFASSESTENQILWALERLGHDVDTIQENHATVQEFLAAIPAADLFFWVRTPGWLQLENRDMREILDYAKGMDVPTVSLHLDRFWGIPDREPGIGIDQFWKTDWVFTADGGNQEKFAARGVSHHWLRPAVSEVYIHPGTKRPQYTCDVGFVGAVEYHPCYPFRPRMIHALKATYGDRFKVVQGVRGHELNDVYASMKVVVGDCIFAGEPYYWSDRLPETLGRHGLLIHPEIVGTEAYPIFEYAPQDIVSLREEIDHVLSLGDRERQESVDRAVRYVANHDTWTIRMAEIIRQVTSK